VKVVHQSPNSRWYSGAGIYRNVWLKTRDKNNIVTDGIYITTKQKDNGWHVDVHTEMNITNDVQISHTIMYKDQMIAATSQRVGAGSNAISHNRQRLFVENPDVWSTDDPNLYRVDQNFY
jgi:beta-galactosidase